MDGANGGPAGGTLLDEPRVASALAEGRQAYVAMATRTGPHVTPELYGWSDGRLWFFAATSTLKAKVLPERSEVCLLVRAGTTTVVAGGESHVLDVADPRRLLESLPQARRAPKAVLDFALRNAADLAGFALDAVRGRTGPGLPPRRLLFGVEARRVALLEDDAVVDAWGNWPGPVGEGEGAPAAGGDGATPAVVAWQTPVGLLALPGRWDGEECRATVPASLVALADAPASSRAAVVLDRYNGPGPDAKEGVLLRGEGTLDRGDGVASVRLAVERETRWDGVDVAS